MKYFFKATLFTLLIIWLLPISFAGADSHPYHPAYEIEISGAVLQQIKVYPETLAHLDGVSLQLNDISRDGNYRGIFAYRGASLQAVLQLAGLKKADKSFKKLIDLAFRFSNRTGESTVLSWGEVFYSQPGEIIIADSGRPIQPGHADCNRCHEEAVYKPRLAPLQRTVSYPKLVLAIDSRADRCLEGVNRIEIIELPGHAGQRGLKPLFAPELKLFGAVKQSQTLTELPQELERRQRREFPVGDGRLYHGPGEILYEGVGLLDLLRNSGVDEENLNQVLLVWSPDGYRTLLSIGEILLGRQAGQLLLADHKNGKKIKDGGRFKFLAPPDLMADRWIKAVAEIEIIKLD